MRPWYPGSTGVHTAGCRRRTGGPRCAPGQYGAVHGVPAPGGFQWPRDTAPGEERARTTSRHSGALAQIVFPITSLKLIISKILYKSAPNDEYESCRSSYPLPLSKRLCSVFLNRFCIEREVLTFGQVFHLFPLKISNANLHESCVPQRAGQLS
jgi:hypothetical protein